MNVVQSSQALKLFDILPYFFFSLLILNYILIYENKSFTIIFSCVGKKHTQFFIYNISLCFKLQQTT